MILSLLIASQFGTDNPKESELILMSTSEGNLRFDNAEEYKIHLKEMDQ